jgi:hypothetical protein
MDFDMERPPAGTERIEVTDALPKGLERRLVLRLLSYWRDLCGDRLYPSFAAVDPAAIADMWKWAFVIEVVGHETDPVLRHVGDALAEFVHQPLVGLKLSAIPRDTLVSHAVSYVQAVIAKGVPISRGGEYVRDGSIRVLYRSILLPMSDDGSTISGLLGAANCREVPEEG